MWSVIDSSGRGVQNLIVNTKTRSQSADPGAC